MCIDYEMRFFLCCFVFRFFPCFLLDEQFFFSSSRQKFDPFLCKEEEFITLKEEDKEEDKEEEELKKRRAGVCSVSRSLSLSLPRFLLEESACFFFQKSSPLAR